MPVEDELVPFDDELAGGASPLCSICIERAVMDTLESLGNPMILDEETGEVYVPKGSVN